MRIKKSLRKEAREWLAAIIFLAMFLFMFFALIQVIGDPKKGVASSEAAGWVQAIGSVAAILVAVMISSHQNATSERLRREVEAAELKAMLEILRIEIRSNLEALQHQVGPILENRDGINGVLFEYPVPTDPTGIFSALIPQIGAVQPPELRRQLIQVANDCGSLAQQFAYNNQLFKEWKSLRNTARRTNAEQDQIDLDESFRALSHWGGALRSAWVSAEARMKSALAALDQAI